MKRVLVLYALIGGITAINIVLSLSMNIAIRQIKIPLMLATYVIFIVSLFKGGYKVPLPIWLAIVVISGLAYYSYDRWMDRKHPEEEPGASPVTIIHGIFAWPLMLPEVIENTYGEL